MDSLPSAKASRTSVWLAAGLLALATLAVYWPATHCDFINCDDDVYLTANPRLLLGLTWENVQWYFSHFYFSNWHPVTSLSYLLDYELWGLKPFGFHLTNILFHALNTALVFLVLWELMEGGGWRMEDERGRMENRMWACALVAALFGLHPLHVESVAWVAERKDVLSGCFGLLTLWAYARYVRRGGEEEDGGWKREDGKIAIRNPQSAILNGHRGYYGLALAFFALGLMSKPMLVTWPFVLLLLDFWPLGRFQISGFKFQVFKPLLLEKIPFFVLALMSCVITMEAQEQGSAFEDGRNLSLVARIGNALVAYTRYIEKIFHPNDLAVFYPHPGGWPFVIVMLAGALVVGISIIVFLKQQKYPFLFMGWFWFAGMLVPVIGLMQVGGQAMADRYAYLPSLGLFIVIVWGMHEMAPKTLPYWSKAKAAIETSVIILLIIISNKQIGYWKNSITLYQHTLAVTKNNYVIHTLLGSAFGERGEIVKATDEFKEAIRLKPDYATAHYDLGYALFTKGEMPQALSEFREGINLNPAYQANFNAINTLLDVNNLAWELATSSNENIRNGPRAVELAEKTCQLTHYRITTMVGTLAAAYAEAGRFDDAVVTAEKACALAREHGETELLKRNEELRELYQQHQPYREKR